MKYCLNCGKELNKQVKKFCDNKCFIEYQYHKYIKDWKLGKITGVVGFGVSKYIRRYLLEKYNYSCQECGWNKINPYTNKTPLEIHHKDGNYLNCSEENLALLCPNCHSLTDTYKSLNRPEMRRDRTRYNQRPNPFFDELNCDKKEKKKYFCPVCGNEITRKAKLCLNCRKKENLKNSNKPSKEILMEESKNFVSYVKLGEKYGVSDNTIREWFSSYDLPLPKRKKAEYKPKVYHPEYQVYTTRKTATGWEKYLKLGQHKIARYVPNHTVSQIEDYIKIFYDEAVKKGIINK